MHHMNETRDIIEVTFTLNDVIEKNDAAQIASQG